MRAKGWKCHGEMPESIWRTKCHVKIYSFHVSFEFHFTMKIQTWTRAFCVRQFLVVGLDFLLLSNCKSHSVVRCFIRFGLALYSIPILFHFNLHHRLHSGKHSIGEKNEREKPAFAPLISFTSWMCILCVWNSVVGSHYKLNITRILLKYESAQIPFRIVFNIDNNNNSYRSSRWFVFFFASCSLVILFKWVPAAWKIPK